MAYERHILKLIRLSYQKVLLIYMLLLNTGLLFTAKIPLTETGIPDGASFTENHCTGIRIGDLCKVFVNCIAKLYFIFSL